jgi:hypothetical protein
LPRKHPPPDPWEAQYYALREQIVDEAQARATGVKHDAAKPRWDLVPWQAMGEVVTVLTRGAEKYGDDNWRRVPRHRGRYLAALMRHVAAWASGHTHDDETGCHHLAHAACCALFLIEREGEE